MFRASMPFALALIFSSPAAAEDVCNVTEFIQEMRGKDGPLDRCLEGDIAHFQVDSSMVPYSTIVARYCDFSKEVVIEFNPSGNPVHVVCAYKWKWAKDVKRKPHPDAN